MKSILTALLLTLSLPAAVDVDTLELWQLQAQVPVKLFNAEASNPKFDVQTAKYSAIPLDLEFRGTLLEALTWNDAAGSNLLLLTDTGVYPQGPSSDGVERTAIYAYSFIKAPAAKTYTQQWRTFDYIDCETWEDYDAEFKPGSVTITDLDNDGLAEITEIHRLACRTDISHDAYKAILREGAEKYAMRGWAGLCNAKGEQMVFPGDETEAIASDSALKANTAFLSFMETQWAAHTCDVKLPELP